MTTTDARPAVPAGLLEGGVVAIARRLSPVGVGVPSSTSPCEILG